MEEARKRKAEEELDVSTQKKHRRAMEDLDIEERRAAIQTRLSEAQLRLAEAKKIQAEARKIQVEAMLMLVEGYTNLCHGKVIDDEGRRAFKENMQDIAAEINNTTSAAVGPAYRRSSW